MCSKCDCIRTVARVHAHITYKHVFFFLVPDCQDGTTRLVSAAISLAGERRLAGGKSPMGTVFVEGNSCHTSGNSFTYTTPLFIAQLSLI